MKAKSLRTKDIRAFEVSNKNIGTRIFAVEDTAASSPGKYTLFMRQGKRGYKVIGVELDLSSAKAIALKAINIVKEIGLKS